jgi:ribonuclease HI
MTAQYIVCADGACSGNPGPGGYGWELWDREPAANCMIMDSGRGRSPNTTNNIMELQAAIESVRCLAEGPLVPGNVKLRFDSEYVLKGIFEWMEGWKKKGWKNASKKPVKNKEQWLQLDFALQAARAKGFFFEANWVKGHDGDFGNERVDEMAVEERDKAILEVEHCDIQQDDVKPAGEFRTTAHFHQSTAEAGLETIDLPMLSADPADLVGQPTFDSPHDPIADVRRMMATVGTKNEEIYPTQVELMRVILELYAAGDYSVKKVIQEIRANKIALGL